MSILKRIHLPSFSDTFFSKNPLYNNQTIRRIFFAIGAAYVFSKLFRFTKALLSNISFPVDLQARYGKGTWALVTGGSDGIGKEFAFRLAHRGFNIVIVSRTKEKLEQVASEIRTAYPTVQVKIIVEDFTRSFEDNFAERIYEQVKDLDISILVNNAGIAITKRYEDIPLSKIRDIVTVNCLSHALLTRALLPKLIARTQKSAILNISSFSCYTPMPSLQIYAASKAFLDYLSRGMSYECPNIDIVSFKPATISTAIIGYIKPNFETIMPRDFVEAALKDLGKVRESYGHWKHKRVYYIFSSLPEFLRERIIKAKFVRTRKVNLDGFAC